MLKNTMIQIRRLFKTVEKDEKILRPERKLFILETIDRKTEV